MDTHYDIVTLPSVASTQDEARAVSGRTGRSTLVVADRQTAGRGRSDRTWIEPDRGMFSSFAFRPSWPATALPLVSLCAAIAVRRSLHEVDIDLKWPNDLLVADRKVGGILVEGDGALLVVGCGLNLWWPEPPAYAGSLFESAPQPDAGTTLASMWVAELVVMLEAGPDAWPHDEYVEACATIGRRVAWDRGTGIARTVRADGVLVVDGPDGVVDVLSGDVHLLAGG